jgi:hypothetical protein
VIRQFPLGELRNWRHQYIAMIRGALLCSIVVIVHYFFFAIHLQVLPYVPPGGTGGPLSVRQGLVSRSSPDWEVQSKAPSLVRRITDLIIDMHRGNMLIGNGHPYSSKWYTWPLFTGRWVLYWMKEGRHILCLGNFLL